MNAEDAKVRGESKVRDEGKKGKGENSSFKTLESSHRDSMATHCVRKKIEKERAGVGSKLWR